MLLSDQHILAAKSQGLIDVEPLSTSCVQPASVDLHLGSQFTRLLHNGFDKGIGYHIDTKEEAEYEVWHCENDECEYERVIIPPRNVILGHTIERITLGPSYAARVEGKSSLARLGLQIHLTGGFIDPGFSGNITLEFLNTTIFPMYLYPSMKIAQISFHQLTSPAARPYGHPELGSKYIGSGADGAVGSLYHKNFDA